LYASFSFGVGGTLGALGAGYLWQQGDGATQTWLMASLMAVLALLMVCLIQLPVKQVSEKTVPAK
jgi:predicted MFS family arabinose efflux permease